MTQPVQEETTERAIGALDFRTRQLARRPGSERQGMPFSWAWVRDGTCDVPSAASPFPVNFTQVAINDPTGLYFDYRTTDTDDPGNDRFELQIREEGMYLIDCVVSWNDTASGDGVVRLGLEAFTSYDPFGFGLEDTSFQVGSDWQNTGGAGDIQGSAFQRVAGIMSSEANNWLTPFLSNYTGATRSVTGVYLKLVRLQSHGPTDDWITDALGT